MCPIFGPVNLGLSSGPSNGPKNKISVGIQVHSKQWIYKETKSKPGKTRKQQFYCAFNAGAKGNIRPGVPFNWESHLALKRKKKKKPNFPATLPLQAYLSLECMLEALWVLMEGSC